MASARAPVPKFGRQMTSVSDNLVELFQPDKITAQRITRSQFLQRRKNSLHRNPAGPSAKGNVGSRAERFQMTMGLGQGGAGT